MRAFLLVCLLAVAACTRDDASCVTCVYYPPPPPPPPPAATIALSLSVHELTLEVGESHRVIAKAVCSDGSPVSQAFAWRSASNAIATVEPDGTIRGVSPGSVWVRATYEDGRHMSVLVKVNSPPPPPPAQSPVRELAFRGDSLITISVGQKLVMPRPSLIMNDSTATRDLTWTTSDPMRVGVNQNTGEITGIAAPGEVLICARAKADPAFMACYPRRVRVISP